jgi:hypothetical protein
MMWGRGWLGHDSTRKCETKDVNLRSGVEGCCKPKVFLRVIIHHMLCNYNFIQPMSHCR